MHFYPPWGICLTKECMQSSLGVSRLSRERQSLDTRALEKRKSKRRSEGLKNKFDFLGEKEKGSGFKKYSEQREE